jgi:hypothetical protein
MNRMGPKVNTDSLILAYDAQDIKNSFLGEPTTNLANNLSSMGPANNYIPVNTVAHSGIVQVSTDIIQPPVPGMTVWKIYNSDPDGYSRFGIGQSGNVTIASFGTYDTTYVASIYVYIPSGVVMSGATTCWATQNSTGVDWHTGNNPTLNANGYYSGDINTLNSEANLNIRDKWQRIFVRFVTSSTVRAYGGSDNCKYLTVQFRPNLVGTNGSSFIYVSSFQLEQKSFPTAFTTSTRASTGGLVNLANPSSTITLANAGFNATGNLTFNGSSNYLTAGYTRSTYGNTFTLIAYYKYTGTSGRTYSTIFGGKEAATEFFIGKNSGDTNIGVQDGNYNGAFVVGSTAFDGNWHQLVYTYHFGTGIIYLDGTQRASGAFTKCNDAEEMIIGGESEGGGYYFDGLIDQVFIYLRRFSSNEVYDHYLQYRTRYGI